MAKPVLKFKKSPRYPHQRSEGTTRRGAARQDRLMRKAQQFGSVMGISAPAFREALVPTQLSGEDLDREMRRILQAATPETILSSTAAMTKLGFSAWSSYQMVEKIILAKLKEGR